MRDKSKGIDIDLIQLATDFLREIRHRAPLYLAVLVISAALSIGFAGIRYSPVYTADATLLVNMSTGNFNTKYQKNNATNKLGKLYPSLLTSDIVKSLVMDDLGYTDMLPATITAVNTSNTNLVVLKASAEDPQVAYDVLQSVIRTHVSAAYRVVGRVTVKTVSDSGVPTEPSNTMSTKKSAAIGLLVGIFLCCVWIVLKEIFRQTVRNRSELAACTDAAFLGDLPKASFSGKNKKGQIPTIDTEGISCRFVNSVRNLAYLVKAESEENVRTILVTSALPDEGKTTVAVNLALELARGRNSVLLVDANLRKPAVLTALGMESSEERYSRYLTVMAESDANRDAANVWSQKGVGKIVEEWKQQYDYVIIDAAAAAVVPDASQIARYADGYIYVVRENYADRNRICEGMDMMADTECKPVGCMINHC